MTMEGILEDFLEDSGLATERTINEGSDGRMKRKKRAECEGIWVRCKGRGIEGNDREEDEAREEENEEDEMIWWTWDGKIVGFTDW